MKVEPWLRAKSDFTPGGSRHAPWFKSSLGSSLFALLTSGQLPAAETEALEQRTDQLRDSIIELLAGMAGIRSLQLTRRIRYATDVQSLWFLRADLMALLASANGEAAARQAVDALSAASVDLLPKGLRSRASGRSGIARS